MPLRVPKKSTESYEKLEFNSNFAKAYRKIALEIRERFRVDIGIDLSIQKELYGYFNAVPQRLHDFLEGGDDELAGNIVHLYRNAYHTVTEEPLSGVAYEQRIPLYNNELSLQNQLYLRLLPMETHGMRHTRFWDLSRILRKASRRGWDKVSEQDKKKFRTDLTGMSFKRFNRLSDKQKNAIEEFRRTEQYSQVVYDQVVETMWYFENMGMDAHQRNSLLDIIREVEVRYRGKMRKKEISMRDPEKFERKFNHFLHVLRISMAMINNYQQIAFKEGNKASGMASIVNKVANQENLENGSFIADPEEVMKLCAIGLCHDLVEDNMFSFDEVSHLLAKLDIPQSSIMEIINGVNTLDAKQEEYHKEDGTIDYESYIEDIENASALVQFAKISDILHNWGSGLEIKNKEAEQKTRAKAKAYEKFLLKYINNGIFEFIPRQTLVNISNNNPKLEEVAPNFWSALNKYLHNPELYSA